jgi:uncharacterized protein
MSGRSATTDRDVFVDTSAYYALADPGDANHAAARRIVDRLAGQTVRLRTTNCVIAESHALLLNRLGRAVALRLLDGIYRGATIVERVTQADEERAWAIITRYDDKDFSITDATSFAVMERLRIQAAFTFDRNFAQYGLTVLSP